MGLSDIKERLEFLLENDIIKESLSINQDKSPVFYLIGRRFKKYVTRLLEKKGYVVRSASSLPANHPKDEYYLDLDGYFNPYIRTGATPLRILTKTQEPIRESLLPA